MSEKKKPFSAKQKVTHAFKQAKESLKILGTLEKETLAKARSFVRIPSARERKKMTNDKILSSLKKLGVATQSELEALQSKVAALETELQHARRPKSVNHST